jgi:formylglycine-generating enzyme required for sulfatase activity
MLSIFPALALSILQSPAWAAESEGDQVTKPYLNGTVRVSGAGGNGFGFIVGENQGMLSIVTPDHVVTSENPSPNTSVSVYFYSNPNAGVPVDSASIVIARLLDLALLQVKRPNDLDWQPQSACSRFERADTVWWIGRNKQWDVPLDNEAGRLRFSKPEAEYDHIVFSTQFVEEGVSGAPLIGYTGILGMVVVDNKKEAEALPIERIQRFVAQKGGAWSLADCGLAQATIVATQPVRTAQTTPTSGEGKTSSQLKNFRDNLKDGGLGPEMVVIPAGSFQMGSPNDEPGRSNDEGPTRQVTIRSFALGRYEVTFDDYDRFARATGRALPSDEGWKRGNRPVINVTWHDAQAYAQWLSAQSGHTYRLPAEAEWEYAARAGKPTPYWWGAQASHEQANYGEDGWLFLGGLTQGRDQWVNTAPVGSFPPNDFELYDTAGNVWEYVADCWRGSYQHAQPDGSAWMQENGGDCYLRVLRGGSWRRESQDVRSASRDGIRPDDRSYSVGFRLARTL